MRPPGCWTIQGLDWPPRPTDGYPGLTALLRASRKLYPAARGWSFTSPAPAKLNVVAPSEDDLIRWMQENYAIGHQLTDLLKRARPADA